MTILIKKNYCRRDMEELTKIKILITAGGTGGHVIPAVSFGKWLKENKKSAKIIYICGSRALEAEIYKSLGVRPIVIPLEGSPIGGTNILKSLKRYLQLIMAFPKAYSILRRYKPDAGLFFGGYTSFAPLVLSKLLGIKIFVHEQNAVAGKVTRLAARLGAKIFCGWSACEGLKKGEYIHVGVPVRRFERLSKEKAWEALQNKFNISEQMPLGPIASVMAGSLGAKKLFSAVEKIRTSEKFKDWTFIYVGSSSNLQISGNKIELPKIWDIGVIFSLSDVGIIRAGASTLSEAKLFGMKTVAVPWEGAADGHQLKNALEFAKDAHCALWRENGGFEALSEMIIELYNKKCENSSDMSIAINNINNALWDKIIALQGGDR